MKRNSPSGGIFFQLILLGSLGFGGWWAWNHRAQWIHQFSKWVRSVHPRPITPRVDFTEKAARVQAVLRAILSQGGVKESDILKDVNTMRDEDGTRWLESSIEIRRPRKFKEGDFLRLYIITITREGLALMRDEKSDGRWTLECGDRQRVFQRFIFRSE